MFVVKQTKVLRGFEFSVLLVRPVCNFGWFAQVRSLVEGAEEVEEEHGLRAEQQGYELRIVTLAEEDLETVHADNAELDLKQTNIS